MSPLSPVYCRTLATHCLAVGAQNKLQPNYEYISEPSTQSKPVLLRAILAQKVRTVWVSIWVPKMSLYFQTRVAEFHHFSLVSLQFKSSRSGLKRLTLACVAAAVSTHQPSRARASAAFRPLNAMLVGID